MNYVTSVSEKHNLANVRRTPAESVEDFKKIVALRDEKSRETGRRVRLLAGLSTSFGCTIEGQVDPAAVLRLAQQFLAAGAAEPAPQDRPEERRAGKEGVSTVMARGSRDQ